METVEVVIKIPKKQLERLQRINGTWELMNLNSTEIAILNGTVLPKGHGKLIDSNVIWDAFQDLGQDFYEAFDFAEANAIIEADKDGE